MGPISLQQHLSKHLPAQRPPLEGIHMGTSLCTEVDRSPTSFSVMGILCLTVWYSESMGYMKPVASSIHYEQDHCVALPLPPMQTPMLCLKGFHI